MKRILILFLIPYLLFSQDMQEVKTDNFIISSSLNSSEIEKYQIYIESLNNKLNEILSLKNNQNQREIVILKDLNSYHEYLELLEIPLRDDFIFLKFSDKRSKLVIYKQDSLDYTSLAHHLTLQYIDFYGGDTPSWFNIGIATYFEDFRLNQEFKQSNKWVNMIKQSTEFDSIYTQILSSTTQNIKPYFSWILIDYLISTDNKEHNRLFWDSLSLLKYKGNNSNNSELLDMYKKYNLNNELKSFITSLKGYKDYIDLGIEEFQKNNFEEAMVYFKKSILIEPNNYSPDYYLGLCYSNLKNYNEAYSHFSTSLDKGAPKNIVYYSIGVNFYNEKEFIQSKKYLNKIDDKMYQVMAEKLLNEISKY